MPRYTPEVYVPRSAAEKKLANPEHTRRVVIRKPKPTSIEFVIRSAENSLGLRLGCAVNQWNNPVRAFPDDTTELLDEAYKTRAMTTGGLFIEVDDLQPERARMTVTMPLTIVGYKNRAVVGVFDYGPKLITDIDDNELLALNRDLVGSINTDAENPFYVAVQAQADPTRVYGANHQSHIIQRGSVGGNRI